MDVATLLYGYRPIRADDVRRKALALQSGYAIAKELGRDISATDFFSQAGEIATHRFGGGAHDSYATTTLSIARSFQPHIDPFLGMVLNTIVVQMNFQSRLSIDGVMGPPEAVLFEGAQEMFPIAMMHGNTTIGVHITDLPRDGWMPEWANRHPSIEINADGTFRALPDEVAARLDALGRSRIGAVMLVAPGLNWGDLPLWQRYAEIADRVSKHTIYCIAGQAEMCVITARDVQERYPHIRVDLRLYSRPTSTGADYRGILIFSGVDGLPEILVRPGVQRNCSFVEATPKDGCIHPGAEIVDYFNGRADRIEYRNSTAGQEAIGRWEPAGIRYPFLLSSSAPLPAEARERISDNTEVFHSLAILEKGILIPSQDPGHAIYVHATGNAEIIMDYGDEGRNVVSSPIYRDSTIDPDGVRHGTLKADRVIRVRGAAMPLMFTPLLHKWHSHFMIQCLPRVRIARDLGRDVTILLPHDMRAKQLEMLATLGIGEDRIVKMPQGALVQADELIVPRAWRLAFTEYSMAIYQEIADSFATQHLVTPKRVLISRESRKSWRNMLNYESVRSMLVNEYGFEVVAAETLTLEEEVATYANAEIVVGAEGAGMYGAVFSRPGTIYLTLCDEDYVMPILGTLAQVRGIDIGYVFGESMRADADVQRRLPFGHADFVIDLDRVERAVQAAIARTKGC
jgi:hypothetical protein